jgi:hypothetical protein
VTHHADIHVPALPEAPLDAAQWFYEHVVPTLRPPAQPESAAECSITIVFAHADRTHRAWRLAAVQDLAREVAPVRLNAIAGDDHAAIDEALAYLRDARGVTGQLLDLGTA